MKKFYGAIIVLVAVFGLASLASAEVNIVYPINGGSYPITGPAPGVLGSAFFTSSFGVTCSGGGHVVKWGFDDISVGSAKFYDQISVQQVGKLPGGIHTFWVDAGKCGAEKVRFKIGQ